MSTELFGCPNFDLVINWMAWTFSTFELHVVSNGLTLKKRQSKISHRFECVDKITFLWSKMVKHVCMNKNNPQNLVWIHPFPYNVHIVVIDWSHFGNIQHKLKLDCDPQNNSQYNVHSVIIDWSHLGNIQHKLILYCTENAKNC